jgi:glycine cleavage system H protein
MNTPVDLLFAKTDEWAKLDAQTATIGISDYAQDQLSDVVFVEYVVAVGEKVAKGQQIATIESVKAPADVLAPLSGKVTAVNEDLPDSPELVNKDPYGKAWLIRIEVSTPAETSSLMKADAYATYCEERKG